MESVEQVKSQVARVQAAIRRLPMIMQPMIRSVFNKFGSLFLRQFTATRLSGGTGLHKRSGSLARSFGKKVVEKKGIMQLFVFTDSKYGRIQEKGGTITPKRAKYLAIPVGPAMSGKVAKFTSPRQVAGLRYMESRAGNKFMGQVVAGKTVVFFVLKKSVTLKGRMRFGPTFRKTADRLVVPMLARGTDKVMGENFERIM